MPSMPRPRATSARATARGGCAKSWRVCARASPSSSPYRRATKWCSATAGRRPFGTRRRSASSSARASTCRSGSSPPSSPSAHGRRRSWPNLRSSPLNRVPARARSATLPWTRTASPTTRHRPACRRRCGGPAARAGRRPTVSSSSMPPRPRAACASSRASSTPTTSPRRSASAPREGCGSPCCPRRRSSASSGSVGATGSCLPSWT